MSLPALGTFILLFFSNLTGTTQQPGRDGLASGQASLFPILASGTDGFIGLSLINASSAANDVVLTWTDPDGISARTGSLSLPPGAQRVALLRELLGIPNDPTTGSLRIDSSDPGLLSYLTIGGDGFLDATAPVSIASQSVILPCIAVNTGFMELEHTDTVVTLANPGSLPANGRAELIGLNGVTVGNLIMSVPPHGSRTVRVSEAFRDVLPPNQAGGRVFRGYMRVRADTGLAGWLLIETPLSRRLLAGFGAEEIVPQRQLMVSHFVFGGPAVYGSDLNLINAGSEAVNLEITAQDDRGMPIGKAARRVLEPGQAFHEDVLGLFGLVVPAVFPPPLLSGYIRIRASDGGMVPVIGGIEITSRLSAAAMLFPIGGAPVTDATLPFAINNADFFTGFAIANPNELLTVQTEIMIELLDTEGHPVGSPRMISLSPAARVSGLIEQKAGSGYLRIRANGPISILGSIGSWRGNMLAPLPDVR